MEFLSYLKEHLAIHVLETYMIILKCLLFSQISYMKIPIPGALFMTVSVLGGTVAIVLVLGQPWLLSTLLLKWDMSSLIVALCPPLLPLNLAALLLKEVEKILLSERWKLIQIGSDHRSFKISNTRLYLNGRLHGKVVDSTYSLVPFLSDLAPTLSNLSNTSAPNGDDIQSPPTQTPTPSSSNWISLCLWNSRSLVNKLCDFQSFIYSSSFNVIAIVENWLSPFIADNEIFPTGFTIHSKDRESCGGGVLLAINDSWPSLQLQSPPDLEVAAVQIGAKGNVVICVVYIPPNADNSYYSKLFDYLNSILGKHQTLILGDFNSPDICWSTLSSQSISSRAIYNLAFRHDLSQLVNFPTHISRNTLDLI